LKAKMDDGLLRRWRSERELIYYLFVSELITILGCGVAAAVVFGVVWQKGYIERLNVFFKETWHELKPGRCSWPTWTELRGSTVLIGVTIALLGVFVFVLDLIFNWVFTKKIL
jgi:preprotein translocase SecE subunit